MATKRKFLSTEIVKQLLGGMESSTLVQEVKLNSLNTAPELYRGALSADESYTGLPELDRLSSGKDKVEMEIVGRLKLRGSLAVVKKTTGGLRSAFIFFLFLLCIPLPLTECCLVFG